MGIAHSLATIDAVHHAHAAERDAAVARDPVRFVHAYAAREDRELIALVAALLAFGNVATIGRKLTELCARLGARPHATLDGWTREQAVRAIGTFRHRTFRGADIARMLHAARRMQRRTGSLYSDLARDTTAGLELRAALTAFAHALREASFGARCDRSQKHLLPDPAAASACKRWLLLLRWLARPDDGVDLGLVAIPTRVLLVPLDVHVFRVARQLGLTRRRAASWKAAEDVTACLRRLDPDDPVKYDFALCHTEIARRMSPAGKHAARRGTPRA